jgi:hypothetical protein
LIGDASDAVFGSVPSFFLSFLSHDISFLKLLCQFSFSDEGEVGGSFAVWFGGFPTSQKEALIPLQQKKN